MGGWYRFGEFQIDLDAFALRHGDEVVPMQRKVFDVLCHLVEHRGRVVTKAELLSELWRNEHVNEGAVAWSVSHIRRALGQQRGDRHPIETVQGRGYRFIADVESGEGVTTTRQTPPLPPRTGDFVGRDRVMLELEQHVREAAQGRGSMCVLTGEAGIGKTRCADELVSVASAHGVQMLIGRCPQEPAAPPLWPIVAALRGLAQDQPELAARARELLSRDSAETGDDASGPSASARFWLIERASHLLRDVAAARPTLLILDDLHWADAASLGLLGFIAQELRDLPLCIVVTLRDGERQPGSHEPLQRLLRHAHTIPLRALDDAQIAELLEKVGSERPSDALASAIQRAAGGIPLFVQEVVRSLLLEHGAPALSRLPPEAVHPPEIARDLLRQRIHRLPAATIALLSQAAVIGDTFDLSLLLALVELEPDVLLDRLEPAIAEGQIESDAPHTYRFVHALFQAVLYDDLPASERVAIHRKLATLLAARSDEEPRSAEIARHYYLSLPAGDYVTVIERSREAGAAAIRLFAFEDAVRFYTWALEAQAFGGATDPRMRAELLLSLASAQRFAGRTLESTQTTARVLDLALQHRLHDVIVRATRLRRPTVAMWMVPDSMARSALETVLAQLPDIPSWVRVSALSQLASIPPYDRDLARSKELSTRAVEFARELEAPQPLFEAQRAQLFALSGPDDIERVLRVTDELLAHDRDNRYSWHTSDAYSSRVLAHTMAGRMREADTAIEQLRSAIGERHVPEATFYCERLAAQRVFLDGHFDDAEKRWTEIRARALRGGLLYAEWFYGTQTANLLLERQGAQAVMARGMGRTPAAMSTPSTRANLARLAAEAGQRELARGELSALGDPSDYPRDGHYLHLLSNMSICAALLEDHPRCEQLLALLTPYAALNTPSPMGYYNGVVAHFLGVLSAALGKDTQARTHFEHALERNRAIGYRAGVVRTLLAHGRLARQHGPADSAKDLLTRARNEAEALGMIAADAEASALLDS